MATWDVTAATDYIRENTLDNEDFLCAEDSRKKALLNVSKRTLDETFADSTVDDESVYQFAAILGAQYNDTMRERIRGIDNFNIDGFSVTFAGGGTGSKGGSTTELSDLIPSDLYDKFGKSKRGIKRTMI